MAGRIWPAQQALHCFSRLAVNANKTWTSLRATQGVHDAIEVLGGNGAIEEFSILPRLYRDAVVLESWEGAHNVLCAQILRDAAERGLADALWTYLDRLLEDVSHPDLAEEREQARGWIEQLRARFERLTAQDAAYAQARMRRWVEHLAATVQALCLLRELDWEKKRAIQSDKRAALAFHAHRFLTPGYVPEDDADYLARLSQLSGVNEG